jgi:hypothetical protein
MGNNDYNDNFIIMKNTKIVKFTFILLFLFTSEAYAQVPQKMGFQAIIRDASNTLIINQQVGIRISILQGSVTGTSVYTETHTTNTNINGLITIEIGTGNVLNGVFGSINWANAPYFIKTESDPAGGSNYSLTSTSQLLSVPYAFHAHTADSVLKHYNNTQIVVKSADETRSSDSTLKNDSELKFVLKSNSTYKFEFNVHVRIVPIINISEANLFPFQFSMKQKLNFDGDYSSINWENLELTDFYVMNNSDISPDSSMIDYTSLEHINRIIGVKPITSPYFNGQNSPVAITEFTKIKIKGVIQVGNKGGIFSYAWSNGNGFTYNDLLAVRKFSNASITLIE